jgi:methionyl-tRNA synthetase
MAEVAFGNDGDFSNEAFIRKINTNLANELGNLCQRTLSLVFKNCDKAIPVNIGTFTPEDEALLASAKNLRERAAAAISTQAIHKYAEHMIGMVWDANKYIDVMEPWVLKKTDPYRMATVLYVILEVLRFVAILYQPIIPDSANKILDQLTVPENERTFAHLTDEYRIRPGSPITKPKGIFPRLEVPEPVSV